MWQLKTIKNKHMKKLVTGIRIFVGVLFIFSGLVKAIDPAGLGYKMQEYFTLWHWNFFNSAALSFSVLMNVFEIVAGVALLIGWKPKLVNWLLLLLIVFFSFLTGYSYFSGKFHNCGCFGDCIPITSGVSFSKDIILLVLILFLIFNLKNITSVFSKSVTNILLIVSIIFSFALQWYVLNYLPIIDCLPYKVGNNISEKMKMPANAVPEITEIYFTYKKEGKEISFTADHFPSDFNDSTYTFVKREDKVIRPGKNNIPPIGNFYLSDEEGMDQAATILEMDKVLVLFVENVSRPIKDWQSSFEKLYQTAINKNVPVYVVTGVRAELKKTIAATSFKNVPILNGDDVMIRTAARVNPSVLLIEKGTIKGKWSFRQFNQARKKMDE
jgi:uncharacterized membrane protein YphA (DoxX/SURF4 family)